ncbi:MAG: tyrosine--tRNA ligase [Planctomycetes bacterium]|nr:tyrosine--tRNA ligase [Planctomycetota bacterium]
MERFWEDLRWRGLIHQATDEGRLVELLGSRQSMYVGFDPTADSLHVGSLLGLTMLRRFQAAGHRPIALVGGATGMIGDPSGKSDERNLLSMDALRANIEGMQAQMGRFLDFDDHSGAVLVNNHDWMRDVTYLDFLRDVGKNFPVNVMLAKESVRSRLERDDAGISYTEFSYMLLQAFDFVRLFDRYGCRIQCGGSDQWGNITAGIDLARRMRQTQLFGATWPLLTRSDGAKMGKTESGTVWLSARRTSAYRFFQYWYNIADEDAGHCLRRLTDLPRDEIESLDAARQADPAARASQRRLAENLTRLVHGDEGLDLALAATRIFFGEEISDLRDDALLSIFADVPSRAVPRERLASGVLTIVDALVEAGLASSKGEARRAVEQGGGYVNNRRIESIDRVLDLSDLAGESVIVLRRGKKNYGLLRFE